MYFIEKMFYFLKKSLAMIPFAPKIRMTLAITPIL